MNKPCCAAAVWVAASASLHAASASAAASATAAGANPLAFDPAGYTTVHVTLDGAPLEVRRYHVVYVAKSVKMAAVQPARGGGAPPQAAGAPLNGPPPTTPNADPYGYQSMYIYVPQAAFNDTKTAIILQVNNGGWLASLAQDRITEGATFVSTNDTDNTGAALQAGYVVVNAGTRSRGIKGADGSWVGKSPAVIVDAKAAVRYLRLNDAVMPGSAERIVITGTSGGGGLSVAVSASGNSADYYPYLAQIGAAGIDAGGRSTLRDDVFATIAYCPITDLGHADIAYEWQYNAVRVADNTTGGQYPAQMQQVSAKLAAAYPAYLASLKLKREDGSLLTAANLEETILAQAKKGTEAGIARGEHIPAPGADFVLPNRGGAKTLKNDWLVVEDGKVKSIDYRNWLRFITHATALKVAPAFDATATTGHQGVIGENTLFGVPGVEYVNFAEYSWNHNEVKGDSSGADDTGKDWAAYSASAPGKALLQQVKMASPMTYLNGSADAAPYWYVRHGMVDRDTSFAIQVPLYYAIRNDASVKDVNFQLAWLKPHSGNYDVREAYAWLAGVLAKAGDPPVQKGLRRRSVSPAAGSDPAAAR